MIGDRAIEVIKQLQEWGQSSRPRPIVLTQEMKDNAKAVLLPIFKPALIAAVPQLATIEAMLGDPAALGSLVAEVIQDGLSKLRQESAEALDAVPAASVEPPA